jgi:hypothetical protein
MLRCLFDDKRLKSALVASASVLFVLSEAPAAAGQSSRNREKALAELIKCDEFNRDPEDGSWLAAPDARIGPSSFGSNRFEKKGIKINGVIVADVLDRKCREATPVPSKEQLARSCDGSEYWRAILSQALESETADVNAGRGFELLAGFARSRPSIGVREVPDGGAR